MDIRLSEAGHVTAVRWRFAVCSIGHSSSSPGCASIDAWSNHLSPVRARTRRCRARVQSARITRSGHTQRTNERARESAKAHFQPLGERASRGYNTHTHSTHRYIHTHTRTACPTQPGLPSSFKGLTDDRHGTERRWVRIHHIFYVPPLVYPSLTLPCPLVWSSANPATARCQYRCRIALYRVQAFPGIIFKRIRMNCRSLLSARKFVLQY